MWMKDSIAYHQEKNRLIALGNTRIKSTANGIQIDYWCDGNELESESIFKLTKNLNRKFKNYLESQKSL